MGTGSFPGVKSDRGVTLTPHPLLVPWSWKGSAIPLLPLRAVRPVQSLSACTRMTFTLYFTNVHLLVYFINLKINSYNKSQRDALFIKFILIKNSTASSVDWLLADANRTSMTNTYCCVYSVEILLMMDSEPVRNTWSTLSNKSEKQCISLAFNYKNIPRCCTILWMSN